MKFKIRILKRKSLLTKRQRFVAGVVFLSLSLFLVEHLSGKSGIWQVVILSILSDVFLYWALREDLKENFAPQVFILPFFYTLAFGFFYLLVPARLLVKLILTVIYALGIYSVFLSQNIFTVSSIRTIALVSAAKTVSFLIGILTFAVLTIVVFTLHLNVLFLLLLVIFYSFFLILHSIWGYALDKNVKELIPWSGFLTLCVAEVSLMLWFWPSSSTILSGGDPPPIFISLFLTGFFYIIIGLSHLWFERRLFKSVLWEYVWVAVVVFLVLVVFTSWT